MSLPDSIISYKQNKFKILPTGKKYMMVCLRTILDIIGNDLIIIRVVFISVILKLDYFTKRKKNHVRNKLFIYLRL